MWRTRSGRLKRNPAQGIIHVRLESFVPGGKPQNTADPSFVSHNRKAVNKHVRNKLRREGGWAGRAELRGAARSPPARAPWGTAATPRPAGGPTESATLAAAKNHFRARRRRRRGGTSPPHRRARLLGGATPEKTEQTDTVYGKQTKRRLFLGNGASPCASFQQRAACGAASAASL